MNLNLRKGLFLALLTALLSGIANSVNKFGLQVISDPLIYTTLKNSLVAVFIISLVILSRKTKYLKGLSKRETVLLMLVGIVGGSLPFYLFFWGLAKMPAINAALIHKTLIFWVALLAAPFLKEKLNFRQLVGLGLIFSANLLVGGYRGMNFGLPEFAVLAATVLWAIENLVAKMALRTVDSDILVAARMGIGSIILLGAVWISGKTIEVEMFGIQQIGMVLITSLLLFGYVTTWYRALKLAPVTLVASILTLATLVTNLITVLTQGKFSDGQLLQSLFIIAGTMLFVFGRKIFPDKTKGINFCSKA